LPGKIGSAGNEDSAINVYFSHLEAMRADGQQPEQSPSHFLWTSVKHESKYVMSQKVARSPKANSPYESRAETEAAVERIHERFKDIRAAIAKEKAQKTSAAADSHPRPRQSALEREALQQSLGALTEARNSFNAACKIVCTSIDTVKRAEAAERLRDG
jgi:hypothetical protein